MSNMSLEELRNQAILDTTNGKITKPIESVNKPLRESDPAFIPSNKDTKGPPARTPVIEGPIPGTKPLSVVNAKFDATTAMPFDINSLEKKPEPKNEIEEDIMSALDKAVEEEKKSITERVKALTEKQYEEFLEGKVDTNTDSDSIDEEIGIDSSDYNDSPVEESEIVIPKIKIADEETTDDTRVNKVENVVRSIKKNYKDIDETDEDIDNDLGNFSSGEDISITSDTERNKSDSSANISDYSDIDDDLSEISGESTVDMENIFNSFKNDIKKVTSPIKKVINLKDFKINDKKVSPATIHMSISDISVADHFLPNAEKVITCSALSGPEMLKLNPQNSTRSRINTLRDIYSIIYKHIESKKPGNFDDWMKVTRFSDLDHIYFALYKATFGGSNFIHYECPNENCSDIFIKHIEFDDLIKYDNDETKNKMMDIYRKGDDSIAENEVQLHQISDSIVVGLRNPSIWNVVIEVAVLSESFLAKYEDLIDIITYIDSVYVINEQNGTLDPIDMKPDTDSLSKTVARRIKILYDVLRTLPSDNFFELRNKIATTYPNMSSVSYFIPETTCPKCGTKIEAVDTGAQQLLFMRHQLGALGTL